MKLKYLFIVLIGSAFFIIESCKKDAIKEKTTAEKIQAKWQIDNIISNDHTGGVDHKTTYTGNPSDYYDLRPDGRAYSSFQGTMDTSTYTVLNDSKIIIDGTDTAAIQNLTDHILSLYEKTAISSTDYSEATVNLKK